jgi:UDP-glucose 4-epimerase
MSTILVTGGAGYIGSHTVVALMEAGHHVVVIDSLVNSSAEALDRVARIAGRKPAFHHIDLLDQDAVRSVFRTTAIDAVIHFAALKAVGQSVAQPLRYYQNNIGATISLLVCMEEARCRRLVFSSSATVYGNPARVPITEDMPLSATNPYGRSKLMIEDMCRDLCHADPAWTVVLLRYFNPIGAHESGLIGEDPQGLPNNLMPYLMQVAVGKLAQLTVHGADYPTPDGTGVRDYIHVVDLAHGHLAALTALDRLPGATSINLGTGQGYSVMDMINAVARTVGHAIPHAIGARRPGDIATCYADPALAEQLLGWRATRDLTRMCEDSWRWQSRNPNGYAV